MFGWLRHSDRGILDPMTTIVQKLRSEYSGKTVAIDVLIDRYELIEADIGAWRMQVSEDGIAHKLESGFIVGHPLVKHMIAMERLLHITLRELMFAVRLENWDKVDEDNVDTFLAEIQRTNRPHFNRTRGD
jgi:hypothetical protein